MNAVISCVRCGRADAPALTKPPIRSALGTEIAKKGVLEKVGGAKGEAVQKLIGGDAAGE